MRLKNIYTDFHYETIQSEILEGRWAKSKIQNVRKGIKRGRKKEKDQMGKEGGR